jgi:hypothetical protein
MAYGARGTSDAIVLGRDTASIHKHWGGDLIQFGKLREEACQNLTKRAMQLADESAFMHRASVENIVVLAQLEELLNRQYLLRIFLAFEFKVKAHCSLSGRPDLPKRSTLSHSSNIIPQRDVVRLQPSRGNSTTFTLQNRAAHLSTRSFRCGSFSTSPYDFLVGFEGVLPGRRGGFHEICID